MRRALFGLLSMIVLTGGCDAVYRWNHDPLQDSRSIQPHERPLRKVPRGIVPTDPRGRGRGGVRNVAVAEPAATMEEAKALENPFEATRANIMSGKVPYERYCSHCHGDRGYGFTSIGSSLNPRPKDLVEAIATMTDGELFGAITFGRGRFPPALGPTISVDDRWRTILYVRHELPRTRHGTERTWDQPSLIR